MSSELINQLITPFIFSVFAFGFAAIWYNYRQFASAGLLAISYFSGAMGFLIEAIEKDDNRGSFLAQIGDMFYLFAPLIFAIAMCRNFDVKPPVKLLTGIFLAAMAIVFWYRYIETDIDIRTQVITITNGLLLLTSAFFVRSHIQSRLDTLVFWLLALFALQFFVTLFFTRYLFDETITSDNFSNSVFFAVINFGVSGLALSMAVSLFVKFGLKIITGLRGQTYSDDLTGLLNRRGFEHEMNAALSAPEIPFERNALIVCDLDHFKKVNDSFGHQIGDGVILAFANLLKRNAGKDDLVGRIGGEEFCIFMPGGTDSEAAQAAEALRHAYSMLEVRGIPADHQLTASFGVAHCKGSKSETLFRRADAALYRAKQLGRDRVEADSARTEVIRMAG